MPFQPELGMGAVGEGGVRIVDDEVIGMTGVSGDELAVVEAAELADLHRRARRFRGDRRRVSLAGRTALVVDDGIATGSTARAACRVARAAGGREDGSGGAGGASGVAARIGADADEVVCLEQPEAFFAIGQFYADFSQTSDEEVVACLDHAAHCAATAGASPVPHL